MNRATKQVEVEHPHCGKIVTVIGLETMEFVADKDELIPMKR